MKCTFILGTEKNKNRKKTKNPRSNMMSRVGVFFFEVLLVKDSSAISDAWEIKLKQDLDSIFFRKMN